MKRSITLAILLLGVISAFGQVYDPVSWEITNTQKGDTVTLRFKATVEDGWHLYDTNLEEGGPISTSLNFEAETGFASVSNFAATSEPIAVFDPSFQMNLRYFGHEVTFTKTVVLTGTGEIPLKGYVEYMACNDETCTPPNEAEFNFIVTRGGDAAEASAHTTGTVANDASDHQSYWSIFFWAFLSGFAALLTPCVFPMIPMTVSFFTKQSQSKAAGIKNASIYGLFIVLIYVVLGSLVTLVFGADALNALSTNPWFNTFFFVLLVVFAISFLGAFEIVLPSKWVNKADQGADKGGVIGSFFMALTLALVSFSCTGPIVGTLLVQAASEGGIAPTIGMLGFGSALALPFALFAAFPGYLNSLPKSGGWLNSVKVVLGFLELALAFKFLSMADLVLDLHLLEREVYIAIWIAIFGALAFYLFGKLTLPHDSKLERLPVSRLLLGLLVMSFTIYMVPGLWGAPLKLISAFPPPLEYSESPEGVGYKPNLPAATYAMPSGEGETTSRLEQKMEVGPQGLSVFHDYEDALAYARQVNKPLFIDFTGKACVNCRQMEINVWSDPEVNRLMKNEYVIAALYVDYRKKLPEEEQYVSEVTGKKIRTEGNKWSDFQIRRFKRNSQPHYVLLDHDEKELVPSKAYEPDIKAYAAWLKNGLDGFQQQTAQSSPLFKMMGE